MLMMFVSKYTRICVTSIIKVFAKMLLSQFLKAASVQFLIDSLYRNFTNQQLCLFLSCLSSSPSSISWSRVIWTTTRMSVWAWAEAAARCDSTISLLWRLKVLKACMWSMAVQVHSWHPTLTVCQRTTSGHWHVLWRHWTLMEDFILSVMPAQSQPSPPQCTATRTGTTCRRVPWRSQSYD